MQSSEVHKTHERISVDGDSSVHAYIAESLDQTAKGTFVFSHGYGTVGVESRRIFLDFANQLASNGWRAIVFDYRGSGYSDGLFEEMTFETEVRDLIGVISFARQREAVPVAVWGASFGSAVAAEAAARLQEPLSMMILWSLSARLYERYRQRLGEELLTRGWTLNAAGFLVRRSFLDSLKDVDTFRSIHDAGVPTLLVHGTADDMAPVALSREAKQAAPHAELVEIPGGSHGFKLQPELFEEASSKTFDWIARHQSKG